LTRSCPLRCSFSSAAAGKFTEAQIEQIHSLFEAGASYASIQKTIMGMEGITYCDVKSLMVHHQRHLSPAESAEAPRISSMAVLDQIIAKGFANSASWRPSLADVSRAIDLKAKLSGNATQDAMDELLNTLESAALGDEGVDDDGFDTD
jgi:hypothetical protein